MEKGEANVLEAPAGDSRVLRQSWDGQGPIRKAAPPGAALNLTNHHYKEPRSRYANFLPLAMG